MSGNTDPTTIRISGKLANHPVTVLIDVFGLAKGAMLMQNSHLIAFFRKLFCPRLRCSSTYIRELHAITIVVKKWHNTY
jgi:hypothetical protein